MMISDILEQQKPHDLDLSLDQRKHMQDLIDRLKEITQMIEELDRQEERVQGNSSSSRDQMRAINISRIVYVNEQKDIERKLGTIVNSAPPGPDPSSSLPTPSNELEISQDEVSIERVNPYPSQDANQETREIGLDNNLEIVPVSKPMRMIEPRPRPAHEHEHISGPRPMHEHNSELRPRSAHEYEHITEPRPGPLHDTGPKVETRKSRFKFNVLSFNICPICDARVPANFKICGRCGTKLQNFCPHCGAAVPGGVAFCGKCGKNIT